MSLSDEYLSDSEKIDRIYRMLRTERRARLVGLVFKLILLWAVIYGYYYLTLPSNEGVRQKITEAVQTKMAEFIGPMVGSVVRDLPQNIQTPGENPRSSTNRRRNGSNGTLPAEITQEMIQAVQDSMRK